MSRLASKLAAGAGILLWLSVLAGCKMEPSVNSSFSTTVGGREVTGTFDAKSSITTAGTTAEITFGEHRLTIESERILLNGKEKVRIPVATKKLKVECKKGALAVSADGNEVLRVRLSE